MNRLAILQVDPTLFLRFQHGLAILVTNPLPEDVTVRNVCFNCETNTWYLVCHSDEFAPVENAQQLPQLKGPTFTVVR